MSENDMRALYYVALTRYGDLDEEANDELSRANEGRLNRNFSIIQKAIAQLYERISKGEGEA